MPSTSESQQNFFKLVNAYKKGGLKKSEVSKDIVSTAKSMTKKQISDYLKLEKKSRYDITENDIEKMRKEINDMPYKRNKYIRL